MFCVYLSNRKAVAMKINNTMDRWNILDYAKTNVVQEYKYIKDVVPELKNQQIKTVSGNIIR